MNTRTLHRPGAEHDACGVGFVADLRGRRSRDLVEDALLILQRLAHRGAVGADPETGDGAGILLQIPHALLAAELFERGVDLPPEGRYALAMLFLDPGAGIAPVCDVFEAQGFSVLHVREVPVDPTVPGETGRLSAPRAMQLILLPRDARPLDRALFVARRAVEMAGVAYICSLSAQTVTYKGLLKPDQLPRYYRDLQSLELRSAFAIVHQRFSTNTASTWRRAQPFRHLAHNGEINTLQGNLNRMAAREPQFDAPWLDRDAVTPILDPEESDSANLDRALELLLRADRSLPHAAAMLMPEAWEGSRTLSASQRAFWAWHAAVMEPWDGPACAVYTDGVQVGAALDRNGLRPARWTLTRSGRVVLASEAGVLDLPASEIERRGRLGPGQQLLVDPARGRLLLDPQIKGALAHRRPYRKWLTANRLRLNALAPGAAEPTPRDAASLRQDQAAFGWTREDERTVLSPMARTGKEPVGAMGDDTPLAVLSERPQSFFDYFKQRFAQVTNPPIDPIRERAVMSLRVSLGAESNLFDERPEHCRQLELDAPVLSPAALARLEATEHPAVSTRRFDATFAVPDLRDLTNVPSAAWRARAADALEAGVERLCADAADAVREGATILILSDRGHGPRRAPVPAALATAAVQHHLLQAGLRGRAGLVVESGEVRETHHAAVLLGFGAGAVVPWLAVDTADALAASGRLDDAPGPARARLLGAFHRGLLKILSKMGISTLESYRGAQLFEILGLDRGLVDRWFAGTRSDLGGADLGIIAAECLLRHRDAWEDPTLPTGGRYQWRRDGEPHAWNPVSIGTLQHAVRSDRYPLFQTFAAEVDRHGTARHTLRALLQPASDRPAVPLDEVEPVETIVRRFRTGAMSFGSLSREAHETLAEAMNRLGGRSNSGEGGEDPARDGTPRRSAIRQVASGRFGVTPRYLVQADELQIKMAQGAKPGEGGQLPGHKVDEAIAATRHATPGVTLISPPPHHDIYSIEDLHQLIHDLKEANDRATVSVKLVAQGGIGAVAAGVAKAGADGILISGRSGGTGASPLSSVRHTGLPWELGIAEVRQALLEQGLRDRVTLEVDGHLKTGRDVLIAALLGAERFGFGTAALVATGCVLMRVCHKNTCPVGVATQDPALRALFPGEPEHVVRFMVFVARQVRELLAELGYRRLDDVIGRTDLLRPEIPESCWKAQELDLMPLLAQPARPIGAHRGPGDGGPRPVERSWLVDQLDRAAAPAITRGRRVAVSLPVLNTDRSVGTHLSSILVRQRGAYPLPEGTIQVSLLGTAGQSLGAFLAPGIELSVEGGANDAVGKGMSGGVIAIRPPAGLRGPDHVLGNVALYGATGGRLFVRGIAGERFAVRNSGAVAVVEGLGDHGCEYMTGGRVLVLGPTGGNFGAGMSGGEAFVLDRDGLFRSRIHRSDVRRVPLSDEDCAVVCALLDEHYRRTDSHEAARVLRRWAAWRDLFVKVVPASGAASLRTVPALRRREASARDVG